MIAGQILLDKGIVDDHQLSLVREALAAGGRLDRVVVDLGFASEEDALAAVGEALGLETIDLANVEIDVALLKQFPVKLIHQHQIFPQGFRQCRNPEVAEWQIRDPGMRNGGPLV
jgi:hypothetical protein